jgi:predicted transcriptional regulator
VSEASRRIFESLLTLKSREESEFPVSAPVSAAIPPAPLDWRKSITKYAITCLECGQTFKQLSSRHLRRHDLDGRSYRTKYGLPRTLPLAAKATTAKRRQIVSEIKPWEKAPTYMKAQEAKAASAKKAGRKKTARKR